MKSLILFTGKRASLVNVLLTCLIFFVYAVLLFTVIAGCSQAEAVVGPKRQVVSYGEYTVRAVYPLNLNISMEFGNIELFTWDKDEIKLETSAKLRGTDPEDKLKEGLNDFDLLINEKESGIDIKSIYNRPVKSPADRSFDVKVYIPRSFFTMNLVLDTGSVKFFDDIKCDLAIHVNKADVEINRIEGTLNVKGGTCNLRIGQGKLGDGSAVKVTSGHIRVKAELQERGMYDFETGAGNIELSLPEGTNINFDSNWTADIKDFENADDGIKIRVHTGIGNVSINKF